MSYAGLPAGFSVAEQPKPATYHGLPEGFTVQSDTAPSFGEALAKAPGSAMDEVGNAVTGAGHFIASLPDDPLGYKIGRALKAAPGAIGHELGGILQYVRNLSPPDMRGSAPELAGDTSANAHPWLALGHGDTAPMRQAIADRPLSVAGDVVGAAGLTAPGRMALGKVADLASAPVRGMAHAIADITPERRAARRLLEASTGTPGQTTENIAHQMQTADSGVPGLYYSAAQATQDPAIAALEKQSRMRPVNGPAWGQFDSGQNTALVHALDSAVGGATDEAVTAARNARDVVTRPGRQAFEAIADQGSLEPHSGIPLSVAAENVAAPIRDTVERELAGRHGAAPGAARTGDYVSSNAGVGTEPAGRTYEARKTLADALNRKAGINLSDIESSAKSANAMTRTLVANIDSTLDRASGGIYRQYMDRFIEESPNVKSVEAMNDIRQELAERIRGGAVDLNGEPLLSRSYLKQIFERHGSDKFGSTLLPEHQASLDTMLNARQQMDAPLANYRATVTGGGGSDTMANALLHGAKAIGHGAGLGPVMRVLGGLGETISEGVGSASNLRLGDLLRNPRDAAAVLRDAAEREGRRSARRSTGVKPAVLGAIMANQRPPPDQ